MCNQALMEDMIMKWVNADDKSPEDKQRVLVCFIDDIHRATWHKDNSCCQIATYHEYYKPSFGLDCESVGGYICLNLDEGAVQYWMPLPEPPPENDADNDQ